MRGDRRRWTPRWGGWTSAATTPASRAYRALREHVKALPHEQAMALVDDVVAQLGAAAAAGRTSWSWDELRALAAEGVDARAAHAARTPRSTGWPRRALADEVAGSLADLRREIGADATPAFAYPGGGVSRAAARAVRDAGIGWRSPRARGVDDLRTADPLRLARINVGQRRHGAPARPARRSSRCAALARRASAGAAPPAPAPATPRPAVAYVMSRFPKISETFILAEIARDGAPRRARRGLSAAARDQASSCTPRRRPVRRARALPAVRSRRAILASQLAWLRERPARLPRGAARHACAGPRGSLNFLSAGSASFPKVAHVARLMQRRGRRPRPLPLRQPSGRRRARHPAPDRASPTASPRTAPTCTSSGRCCPSKVAEAAFVATVSGDNRR